MTDDEQPMNTGVNRALVSIEVGSMVLHQREVYRINQVLDFNSVVGLSIESGRAKLLRVAELAPAPKERSKVSTWTVILSRSVQTIGLLLKSVLRSSVHY